MRSSERTRSYWEVSARPHDHTRLQGSHEADVCVVGAGVAGMTTAYLLAREGRQVIVLDDNAVGGGETGQTAAHLASANDDAFHVLERMHGEEGARLVYRSHHAAIDEIGRIAEAERIDCEFERVDGYWFLGAGTPPDFLDRELEAARRAGADVELRSSIPDVPFQSGPALRFARQGQFHPLKYLQGLASSIARDGGRIHTGNHVMAIEGGEEPRAAGDGFEVRARAVAVCTNTPVVDRFAVHTKQAPYRTFVVAARIPRGSLRHILLWDTLDPYHYVRVAPVEGDRASDLLIVGGEDHKTAHQDDAALRFASLEHWARRHFPMMGPVEHRWSGQVMEPADRLAFIGRDAGGREHVYVATGDSGQGITHGTIAGMVIRDQILGRANPWAEIYSPTRKAVSADAIKEWMTENLDVGKQYLDLLPGVHATADDPGQIAPGGGAILQRGAAKVAAFRTEAGVLVERSALCTHLGCVVRWNTLERSWDCPCHGSRFAPTGEVLNGPASVPLSAVEPSE